MTATRTSISCCIALAVVMRSAVAGDVLYNGIELPDKWPPTRTLEELRSGKLMEVPYLENPVLRPNRRWEVGFQPHSAMCFSDGVFYDSQDGLFKLWYRYSARGGTAIATSKDAIHWDKPSIKDSPQPGTNIVLMGGNRDSATVWIDHNATDRQQRFKLFQFHRDSWQASVHSSPDGIHWSEPTWCGRSGDRSTMFYNPFRKVWVYSIRAGLYAGPWNYRTPPYQIIGRCRLYWESEDFLTGAQWESGRNVHGEQWAEGQPQYWLACDSLDTPPQGKAELPAELYNFDAAPYESLMVGYCSVLHSGPRAAGRPKINSVMLAFSRDGYHFHRPFREAIMTTVDDPQAWNYGNVQSVAGGGVIVGNKLYLYASGRNSKEDTTGLYIYRRDGFASMDAGTVGGTLTTRPLRFRGKHLFVNLAAHGGELRVEALDGNGAVIMSSAPLRNTDATLAKVQWTDAADLSKLSNAPLRFRFSLTSGALYAFWVTPDENGASHGYVAGGGPGFTGQTDTTGNVPLR